LGIWGQLFLLLTAAGLILVILLLPALLLLLLAARGTGQCELLLLLLLLLLGAGLRLDLPAQRSDERCGGGRVSILDRSQVNRIWISLRHLRRLHKD
jgi:hypothetical protein